MKLNREQFLAAALLLSSTTGCDKIDALRHKDTATAAPETQAEAGVTAATTPDAVDSSSTPAVGQPKTGVVAVKHATVSGKAIQPAAEGGLIAPSKEVVGPANENVGPAKENVMPVGPAKENIAPVGPANEKVLPVPTHAPIAPSLHPKTK